MTVAHKRFTPGSIRYDDCLSASYVAGRSLSGDAAATWRAAIQPFVPRMLSLLILDLGAGTGRFSPLLATLPRAQVIAVEPSRSMLSLALQQRRPANIAYISGTAEAIPLRDSCCAVAWLSQVFHHIRTPALSARELRRVVRSGGRVFVRGTFGDQLDGLSTLFRFFPGARRICEDLPTTGETVEVFEEQSFTLEAHRRIQQSTCGSLLDFAARVRWRADTSLMFLPDREFEAGLASLQEAAANESQPAPVLEVVDLLVLARRS